jgi:hypothetical protein
MSMGRPREAGQKDLPPGLYIREGRDAEIKLKGMNKALRLRGVRDREVAINTYWKFKRKWDEKRAEQVSVELDQKLETVAETGVSGPTIAAYMKTWRTKSLPRLVRKRGDKLVSKKTVGDYERMLRLQAEEHEEFKKVDICLVKTAHIRRFLARWMGNPNYYNDFKSLLSRVFEDAIAEDLLQENPTLNIKRRPEAKRDVYIPLDHYLAISNKMEEWEAKVCDLIYLVSHRPGDVLKLRDEEPFVRYETRRGRKVVILSFQATKNEQAMEIIDYVDTEGGIEEVLQWFRDWKSKQGQLVKHFICYPTTSRRRSIGKPVSVSYLSRQFKKAREKANKLWDYTPRDLRKKGLTDEARIAGKATNKGGHKTQAMREYYVVGGIPQRHRNNLRVIR